MKYIPLQGQSCNSYEIHTLTGVNPVNYMMIHTCLTATTLWNVYEIYPYRDNHVNYLKYIPLQGQPCNIYEIHILYRHNPVNYMKYIPLQATNR